jgi:hypothetical protein
MTSRNFAWAIGAGYEVLEAGYVQDLLRDSCWALGECTEESHNVKRTI